MEDISITFDGDMSVLGGAVYINRKAFSDHVELMNHTQEDEFNKRLDDLIEANNRAELAKYPFVSFTKPADFDLEKYCVEPMGWEHTERNLYGRHHNHIRRRHERVGRRRLHQS